MQVKIFNLFDSLILMKSGQIAYQGSCKKVLMFLDRAGLPCPPEVNPADHLLDAINPKQLEENAFDDNAKKEVRLLS
jgi:hypothetical protein